MYIDSVSVTGDLLMKGTRISQQLDLTKVIKVLNSTISWESSLQDNTAIVVETRVSFNGGLVWSDWYPCVNGSSIPLLDANTFTANTLVECRQILMSDNTSSTPTLSSVIVSIMGTGQELLHAFNF